MQPLLLVDGLWSSIKVLLEFVAQVNVYLSERTFAFAESFEMLISKKEIYLGTGSTEVSKRDELKQIYIKDL